MGKEFMITVTHSVKASLGPEKNERENSLLNELKTVISQSVSKLDDTDYFVNGYDDFFKLSNRDYKSLLDEIYKCINSTLKIFPERELQEAFLRNYYDFCYKAIHGEEYADEVITISWGKDEINELNINIHSIKGIIAASLWLAAIDIIRVYCTPGSVVKLRT